MQVAPPKITKGRGGARKRKRKSRKNEDDDQDPDYNEAEMCALSDADDDVVETVDPEESLALASGSSTRCSICLHGGDEELVLLCDSPGCGNECHMYCLCPPLTSVPEDEWLCPCCNPLGTSLTLLNFLEETTPAASFTYSYTDIGSEYLIGRQCFVKCPYDNLTHIGRILTPPSKSRAISLVFFPAGAQDRNTAVLHALNLNIPQVSICHSLVWAKVKGHPYWPAKRIMQYFEMDARIDDASVVFYGDGSAGKFSASSLFKFPEQKFNNLPTHHKGAASNNQKIAPNALLAVSIAAASIELNEIRYFERVFRFNQGGFNLCEVLGQLAIDRYKKAESNSSSSTESRVLIDSSYFGGRGNAEDLSLYTFKRISCNDK